MAIRVKSIKCNGYADTYDIHNKADDVIEGNFVIDGMIVHNSILSNGVKTFEDLMLLNAMGHPGPMQSIPEAVANRDDKSERWKKRLHQDFLDVLESTYGVIVYQEQLQAIWQKMANFTSPEAQEARKAVAKKWAHKLKPIKQKWLDDAGKKIGKAAAEEWWERMETFGRYAFNKCLHKDTVLKCQKTNSSYTVEEWYESENKPFFKSYDNGEVVIDECVDIFFAGEQEVFEVEFEDGTIERVTKQHKFLCQDGKFYTVGEIFIKRFEVILTYDLKTNDKWLLRGQARSHMKIRSMKSIGMAKTYSPEMKSHQHNYITEHSRTVHRNSHSVSYCLIAMRCLWFKAHFAPEFWAAIMSDCHPKKLPRYMGVARSENWQPTPITYSAKKPDSGADCLKFTTIDINNLKMNFSVSGNSVNQGMIGIKGIGEKAAQIYEGTGNYISLDQFVKDRTNKSVIERFIKLGAFLHLPGHGNSNALWHYYQYHYASCGSEFKRRINNELLIAEGWDDAAIKREKERQISEYKKIYPKRNKIPPAITNWKPKVVGSLDSFNKIITDDFTLQERLIFQKEYIGYFIDSPMSAYRVTGDNTFAAAREKFLKGEEEVFVNVILEKIDLATTKTGKPFAKLICNDGITDTMVFMWANELRSQDENNMIPGIGVNIMLDWDEKKNLFCVRRGHRLYKLKKR